MSGLFGGTKRAASSNEQNPQAAALDNLRRQTMLGGEAQPTQNYQQIPRKQKSVSETSRLGAGGFFGGGSGSGRRNTFLGG